MTAPDTDTLIALAREGRIAVVSQWRWRHKNELSSWRGWHDGQPVVPFSEWNRDIYEWEERLSYVLPEGAPTLTPALRALAEERDRLRKADGTERLCRALYGRKASARDYVGGSDARMLHDAADRLAANMLGGPVRAVSDNGKRWRIVPVDGDWEMQPTGHITAGEAEALCKQIEAALSRALTGDTP